MDHMSYPSSGTFENNGPCPSTHPVKVPQVFFEVIWDTKQFNNKADWPADGSQPFVWSFGDKWVHCKNLECIMLTSLSGPDLVHMLIMCLVGRGMLSRKWWTRVVTWIALSSRHNLWPIWISVLNKLLLRKRLMDVSWIPPLQTYYVGNTSADNCSFRASCPPWWDASIVKWVW